MSPGCFSERRQSAIWGESFWGYWAPNAPTWLQDQLAWWATVERYWPGRGTRSALLSWILPRYLCLHEKERGEEWGRGGGAITILMNYPTTSNMMPVRGQHDARQGTCYVYSVHVCFQTQFLYMIRRRSLWTATAKLMSGVHMLLVEGAGRSTCITVVQMISSNKFGRNSSARDHR